MKNYYAIILLHFLLYVSNSAYSQGANCASASPFCTGNAYTFPASVNTVAESGPDYGCLLDQPNPAWYYLQIETGGTLNINLTNSADIDIDFICWGPFSTLASACSNLTGSGPFDGCSLFDSYPCGNIIDCSFETWTSETCFIPNAQPGEFYMFLITNYDNAPTNITATSTGTATTDCSIVPPQGCYISYLSIEQGICGPGNTFTMSGEFTYEDNPGTGSVVVEVDNGTSTYTQTFNPPFVDGQTYNYSIAGVPADGATCTVSVYFTADPACEMSGDIPAPDGCDCFAELGTETAVMTGDSQNEYSLCYGDQLVITPNGDIVPPEEVPNPNPPTVYDPGYGWLVFSCPPTIGVTPAVGVSINNDPCFLGYYTDGTLTEVNDMFWIDNYPGVFTDNTVYFVPITMYSIQDIATGVEINGQPQCYEMGTPYAVQYLPEITFTQTTDCATGEATATINGGLPEIDGSQFTAVAGSLTPASASFVNTTCANGGDIVIDGLTSGQAYSFDVTDANGCPITISGTMTGGGGATLTYPQPAYCINAANPSPTVTGSAGGTFSSAPAGLSINAASGVINLSASTAGTYTVTYVGVGGACPPSATFNVTVNALPVVVAGPDQTICTGQQVTLCGSGANSYTWTGGVSDCVAFTPGVTATYTVTGTSAAGCTNTDVVNVNVDPAANPVFAANITSGCSPLTVTFTNQSGGVNCAWDFGDGTNGTGCATATHTYTAVGCYDVTLTTQSAAGCVGTVTLNNYICVTPDPVASFIPNPIEMTTDNTTSTMSNGSTNADTYLWTFEDGSTSTLFEPTHGFPAAEGTYGIELIAYSISGCTDTAWATVVVKEDVIYYVPNTFTPDGDEHNQGFLPVFTSGFDPFNFNMKIFNRWGEVVFETNNHLVGWDGTYHEKLVQDGTFTWKIEFKISANDSRRVAVGHINVIR